MKQALKNLWNWFLDLFRTRYKVCVSYNSQWGDNDDVTYNDGLFVKISCMLLQSTASSSG